MQTIKDELRFWLALNRTPGVGTRTFSLLLEHLGEPRAVFDESAATMTALGLPAHTVNFLQQPDWSAVQRDLRWLEGDGNSVLTLHDPDYPERLREIPDPPPVLFLRGRQQCIAQQPQLAVVGSRNPTHGGEVLAADITEQMAGRGVTITSGLALGIDAAAHRGTLRGGGWTIAVAGCGLDRVYPARNRELAHEIVEHGTLVSEFPPGTPPARDHFPRRNRIISGLAQAVLVVEAAARSGSLITARCALEQGRDVMAVPGAPYNPRSRGCNALLRQGAALVETADDIQMEMGWTATVRQTSRKEVRRAETIDNKSITADSSQRAVLENTGFEPTPVDSVVERSGLTPEAVSSILLMLELQGLVVSAPGGCYCRTA